MADGNMGKVTPLLRNVQGRLISGPVELTFVNQTVRSRDQRFLVTLPRLVRDVEPLPLAAQPNGFYQVFINPERYRDKSAFVSVPAGSQSAKLEQLLFVEPDKAHHRFPSFDTLRTSPEWAALLRALEAGGVDRQRYDAYAKLEKGCLFNLHAKMQAQKVAGGESVFSFVESVIDVKEDRIFCRVKPELVQRTRDHETGFGAASGTLHEFDGHAATASFKTHEKVGNLQLTFFEIDDSRVVLDADLDDHQGIQHAFDVIRHKLTGGKTNPFDIHQILIHFHHIHPGYHLW